MRIIHRFSKWLGLTRVRTIGNQVRITGVDGHLMRRYFKDIFESDAIAKIMFKSLTDTSVTFNQFFIPDVVFMLTKMRMHPKATWATKRTIDRIMQQLLLNTWYKVTVQPFASMVDASRLRLLKWKPMPKQIEFLHLYGDKIPQYDLRGYILAAGAGTGKMQPLYSRILTPDGWSTMGDMKVGSKVVAHDGTTSNVVGVYPHGKKDIFRVTFEDGRWADCGEEHLWRVYAHKWRRTGDGSGWKTLTLKDVQALLELPTYRNRLYIPLSKPRVDSDISLPLDPYFLGIMLGDGSVSNKYIGFTTADQFIVDEMNRLIPDDFKITHSTRYNYWISRISAYANREKSEIMEIFRNLGLTGCKSDTKFIPSVYQNSSSAQKLALIQGLMDSDGTVDKKTGTPSFCTTSKEMAIQVQEILRSLGALVKLSVRYPSYTYKGEKFSGKKAYNLSIRIPDASILFRLPRKLALTKVDYQYRDCLRLRICEIDYVGKTEAQCIAIDHPDHLYVTDHYVVTHNTFSDLMVATCVIPPSVAEVKIIVSPKKALHLVWEKTIRAVFHKMPTYWVSDSGIPMPLEKCEYYIFNFEQLDKAVELGKALTAKGVRYFVIVDESHNFADYKSLRTQKLVKLQTLHDKVFFLWASGTPILKHAGELVAFLQCSDPRFDADAERTFRRIFTSSPGRASEIFHHRLGQMMAFKVAKAEVSETKPQVFERPVKLPPSLANRFLMSTVRMDMRDFIHDRLDYYKPLLKEQRALVDKWLDYHQHSLKTRGERKRFDAYLKALKTVSKNPDLKLASLNAETRAYERGYLIPSLPPRERKAFRSALSTIKNIKLKVRGEALGTVLSKRRSECAAALAVYCKPEVIMKESLSKTIFFASSILPIRTLERHLTRLGFEPMPVFAGTNANLTLMMERFDTDPSYNPICATLQSLSEAVPVTSASTVVFLNRPFRDSIVQQAVARADRLGQKFPVSVIEITLDTGNEPNVSSTTDDILREVRGLIAEIVGPDFISYTDDEKTILEAVDNQELDPNFEIDDM